MNAGIPVVREGPHDHVGEAISVDVPPAEATKTPKLSYAAAPVRVRSVRLETAWAEEPTLCVRVRAILEASLSRYGGLFLRGPRVRRTEDGIAIRPVATFVRELWEGSIF